MIKKKGHCLHSYMSSAGGRRCPLQALSLLQGIAGTRCASLSAFKEWIRQAYCMRQAPVMPQLFDHISHNLTPSHFCLVNTGLRVWEKNIKYLSCTHSKTLGIALSFKKADVLLGKIRDFQPSDSKVSPHFPCQWLCFLLLPYMPQTPFYCYLQRQPKQKAFPTLKKILRIYKNFPI